MASARKKQDEKNLKTLRELVSLPYNKHCFDCNQRGPTYVNVTIGSFVCTKCSGMLRGLTPPQRVKSISMATYTPDEIDLLRNRGNDYCQKVWLGLFEGSKPLDEQAVHSLMLDKYEKKLYYMEPSVALKNGYNKPKDTFSNGNNNKITTSIIPEPRPHRFNGNGLKNGDMTGYIRRNVNRNKKEDFIVDFAHADIFNATNGNAENNNKSVNNTSFANFDNNPVFNIEAQQNAEEFSIFNLQFTSIGPVYNKVPLFPRMNLNRWSGTQFAPILNGTSTIVPQQSQPKTINNGPPAPSEDRYAALKDLDNALKSQNTVDWNSTGSNSSLYSSPTPAGSLYSSTASPPSSSYGSPSQGQFLNFFGNQETTNNISNPFNTNMSSVWGNTNGNSHISNGVNPFRCTQSPDAFASNTSNNYQPSFTMPINGTTWNPNPFKVTNGVSNNPFL